MNRLPIGLVSVLCSLALHPGAGAQEKTGFETVAYASDPTLNMRIYKPEGWSSDDRRPAIVFFFGGGWRNGSPKQFHQHCLRLAAEGMVAMAAEYRIKSKHDSTPFESFADAKKAMAWARSNAGTLGIDPERIASGGGSAGGHLAAAVAVCAAPSKSEVRDTPDAIVAFNPALDLMFEKVRETWGPEIYAKLEAISPHQNLAKPHPPMILFHGEADTTVSFESARAYVDRAKELGVDPAPVLVGYEGRAHGFFNYGKGDGSDYEDTVRRMIAFFRDLGWIE